MGATFFAFASYSASRLNSLPAVRSTQLQELRSTDENTSSASHLANSLTAWQASRCLDQLRMCLAAGHSVTTAITEVALLRDSLPLMKFLDQEMASDPVAALQMIRHQESPFSTAAYLLERSFISGAPLHFALGTLSEHLRRAVVQETVRKVRSVGVKAVLPLGLCFLPAFVLLTVVPLAVGLFGQMSW